MQTLVSQSGDTCLVRHPLWVRLLGWIGLPVATAGSLYILTMPVWKSNYDPLVVLSALFLGGFPLYMWYQGFKVFPYLRAEIEVDDRGLTIHHPQRQPRHYPWSSIATLEHFATAQVLEVIGRDRKRILAITEQATSYAEFVEFVVKKTGCKY